MNMENLVKALNTFSEKNMELIIKQLKEKYEEYKLEEKQVKEMGIDNNYWEGKASGLMLAIEIIENINKNK